MRTDKHPVAESILVSACLLGLPTRYDGKAKQSQQVIDYLQEMNLQPVPVCPEQLAGLPTPREQSCFHTGDGHDVIAGTGHIISATGHEMGDIFCRGAKMVLQIAQLCNCRQALLKERSPSCGVHQVYLGTETIPGAGVTTALLTKAGLTVLSEEDL